MKNSPLARLRATFALSQTALGYCLGLSRTMVSQVERGVRGLPMKAVLPQAALTLAQQTTPAEPAAEPLEASALQKHQQACQLRAERLAFELASMPARAAWARRRLAALPTLRAVLAPAGAPSPPWLARFEAEARNELVRSGSTAQALLRLRVAALEFEAGQAASLTS